MIVLFIAITFCSHSEKDNIKDYSKNKKNEQRVHLKNNNSSSLNNFMEGEFDSIACYAAYTAVVASLDAITSKKQQKPQLKTVADDVTYFTDECALKVFANPCKATVAAIVPEKADAAKVVRDCAITAPAADAGDCYSAYAALIATLDALPSTKQHMPELKTLLEDYGNFKTKCPTTVHTAACSKILVEFDATVPAKSDTADIKAKCAVTAPPEPKKDSGKHAITVSGSLILLTIAITRNYFHI
jgi:hypothetical protein